jgi:hypothetical protein
MTARLIIGIAACVCGIVCGLYSGILTSKTLDKVDERLPAEERFWPLFWSLRWKLRDENGKFYPGSELLRRARYFTIAFFACLLIAGWALQPFFSRFKL